MKNKYIKIFATGGTFDKEFNEINGELYFKETNLYQLLQLGRSQIDVKIETLMMIDSLLMSDEDRQYILDKCSKEKTSKIIITHGTDTMVETSKFIAKYVKDKVVILTGAMIPIKFGSSDGLFNLGSALSFAQVLESGVYITMNGQYFKSDNVRKNKKLGVFEKIDF
ncbi:MAG: asparaginase [Candidatus Marinimicrobia bacterium]|nr:asparaginase [Candidatus Neomarinimicrobiota bacterium]|tara:strand:- start:1082 stop:1582 length:501 start_codon:yes stop_codon:yes gene_type:complete